MVQTQNKVLETPRLDATAIRALANRELLAVRIPSYCSEEVCAAAMSRLERCEGIGYRVAPDFKKFIGGALFDGADDPSALEQYFKQVPSWFGEYRDVFSPFVPPADSARLELDEKWPTGCGIERIGSRTAFAGLVRGFGVNAEARPHQDMSNWDLPMSAEAQSLKTQLSCLVYLACADEGGELELWDRQIETPNEYDSMKVMGDYGLNRSLIGAPDAVLAPKVGEMIIFNARCIHAVRKIAKGRRFSQNFFIGYRGDEQRLSVFS